jgi:hypothetical protein
MGRGWCWVGGGLGHGPPSSAGSRGWLRCRVQGRLISQRVRRSLRIVASIIHRLWLSAEFEAGAPHAGARTAELEEAKGTSGEMNGVVVSAHASQIPAGSGSSDVIFCGIS